MCVYRALVGTAAAWWIFGFCSAVSAEQEGQESIACSSDNEHEDVVAAGVSLLQIGGFSEFQVVGSAETGHQDIVEHRQSESNGETRCLRVWENAIQESCKHVVIRKQPLACGYEPGFIHIGKTGGGTVDILLTSNGIPNHKIHMHPVTQQFLGNYTETLLPVRDPIDRFVSAFNWAKDGNDGLDHISPPYKREQAKVRSMFDDCFPTVNFFAEQLDDSTHCGELGRSWVVGQADYFSSQMSMGTCFYIGGVLSTLEDRPVTLIHQESLEEDFAAWAASRQYPLTLQVDVGFKKHATFGSTFVSKLGRSKLRKHLEHEYWAQRQLEAIVRKQRVN